MEPYKIKTVRLELPYIRLAGTQHFYMSEAYKKPGFYFVEETNILWRLTASKVWRQITPTNSSPIVYGETKEVFPSLGNEGILYYTDKGIYNWKPQLNTYNLIANANTWESI